MINSPVEYNVHMPEELFDGMFDDLSVVQKTYLTKTTMHAPSGCPRCRRWMITRMKYAGGEEAKIGDIVSYSDGAQGLVVCSIETLEFTTDYPAEQWEYLNKGILIKSEKYGLIHYPEILDSDIELVQRHASI